MTIHELKAWPEYFAPLLDGRKTFEVRRLDRNFQVGDRLRIREWSPMTQDYTSRVAPRKIVYCVDLGPIGCPGFIGLGLK